MVMSLFLIICSILLSAALGLFILRLFFQFARLDTECFAFAFALGFGLLAYLIYFIGLIGMMNLPTLTGVGIFLSVCLTRYILMIAKWCGGVLKESFELYKKDPVSCLLLIIAVFVFMLGYFLTQVPPTAHDAMSYHLTIPKSFARDGGVYYYPYLTNSLFPFLIQMFYMLAIIVKKPELSQAFHMLTGFGCFMGVFAIGLKWRGLRTALTAGLIFILTPGIFNQMVIPYNDVALSFFALFAVYSFFNAMDDQWKLKWWALAGVFSGFALSVKYLAVLHIFIMFIFSAYFLLSKKITFGKLLRGLIVFCSIALLFSAIWYLRGWIYERNPFYPFFSGIFGGTAKEYDLSKAGMGKGVLDFFLVLWRSTMFPDKFGGSWARLGPVFLICVPFYVWVGVTDLKSRKYIVFSVLSILLWFGLSQNLRFLFPAVPFLSLLSAAVLVEVGGVFIFLMLLQLGMAVYHGMPDYRYLFGMETKDQYLARNERTWAVSNWVNSNIAVSEKILVDESRFFYFDPPVIREPQFWKKTKYDSDLATMQKFLGQEGISYMVLLDQERTGRTLRSINMLKSNSELVATIENQQGKVHYVYRFKSR